MLDKLIEKESCFILLKHHPALIEAIFIAGQIKIVQHPKSQNQKEGLKVEFTCNCEVQEKFEVWYQWLKDG